MNGSSFCFYAPLEYICSNAFIPYAFVYWMCRWINTIAKFINTLLNSQCSMESLDVPSVHESVQNIINHWLSLILKVGVGCTWVNFLSWGSCHQPRSWDLTKLRVLAQETGTRVLNCGSAWLPGLRAEEAFREKFHRQGLLQGNPNNELGAHRLAYSTPTASHRAAL